MDRLTKVERSWNMSRIRNKDTKPEMIVRSALHKLGFRYRLHAKNLPGHPDIVYQNTTPLFLFMDVFGMVTLTAKISHHQKLEPNGG